MNGIYSEFAEEGLNNKKYIVYEKLNKLGGGKSFDNAKDAVSMQRRFLQIMGLLCLRTTEKLGKMSLRQNLFQSERGSSMSVYTFTFITMVSMYLAYLWGRWLTRGEIADEVAENTLVG